MDERIHKVITNLQRNNMAGYFVEDKEELLQLIAVEMPSNGPADCRSLRCEKA